MSHRAPRIIVCDTATRVNHAVDARATPKDFSNKEQVSPTITVLHRLAVPAPGAHGWIQDIARYKRYSGHPRIVGHAALEEEDRNVWVLAQSRSQDTSCGATCVTTKSEASDRRSSMKLSRCRTYRQLQCNHSRGREYPLRNAQDICDQPATTWRQFWEKDV